MSTRDALIHGVRRGPHKGRDLVLQVFIACHPPRHILGVGTANVFEHPAPGLVRVAGGGTHLRVGNGVAQHRRDKTSYRRSLRDPACLAFNLVCPFHT